MKGTFLYQSLNLVTRNLKFTRGVILFLNIKPNGYDVAEHKAKIFEVNLWSISIFKNEKSIIIMNPGENFKTPMVGSLGIMVDLVYMRISHGSYKSSKCFGRPFTRILFVTCRNIAIEALKTIDEQVARYFFLKDHILLKKNLVLVRIGFDKLNLKIV